MSKVYKIITDRFIKSLEKGVIPWEKPWTSNGLRPRNIITNQNYKGVNMLLLCCEPFKSPFWLTYKQAQKLGGSVIKGSEATPITYWDVRHFDASTGEKIDKQTAKKILSNPKESDKIKSVPFLLYYSVFNFEQTEDISEDKLPEICAVNHTHEPDERAQIIVDNYISRNGIKLLKSVNASYSPETDEIRMPLLKSFVSVESYYKTVFHEMVHSTGHKTRLNRELNVNMKTESYSKEELTAEIGASFLNHEAGILDSTIENSEAYIRHWLSSLRSEEGAKYIVHAASRAEKAVDFIIGFD